MNKNILVPELAITNLEKSLNFYRGVLGFSIEFLREGEGFAYVKRESVELMLDEIDKGRTWKTGDFEPPFGKGVNFRIPCSDVDALAGKINDVDIDLFMDIEEKWYRAVDVENGNKQFLVQDPDGYLLRFYEDLGSRKIK